MNDIYAKLITKETLEYAPKYMIVKNSAGEDITVEYTVEKLLADGYHLVNTTTPKPEGEGPWHCYWKLESDGIIYKDLVEYTPEEKINSEVDKLKAYLNSTDYIYARCIETGEDVNALYPDVIAQRKIARARIQELEGSV